MGHRKGSGGMRINGVIEPHLPGPQSHKLSRVSPEHENDLPVFEHRLDLPTDMNIPQEIVDEIIDEVWNADDSPSHKTTQAASLVSRSWVNRSQHNLFHDIQFSIYGPNFERWCDAVSPDPNGISRHVRSLTIWARGSDGRWVGEETLGGGLPSFESFRNVRVLRVHNLDIEPFPPEMLTRCFTPFAGSVRVLRWDPHVRITRESWTHVIRLFPLVDHLLLLPNPFPTGLISGPPVDSTRKRLVLSGARAAQCVVWGGGNLRFREIYTRCGSGTTLQTVISIINRYVDRLEVLSITGIRRGRTFSVLCVLILNSLLLQ